MAERLAPTKRHQFLHGGRVIYEWDQTLTEVNMYIPVPADMSAKEIFCDISKQHVKFGRKGNPPFLDVSTGARALVVCRKLAQHAHLSDSMCHADGPVRACKGVRLHLDSR